ncbi:PDZ domain-containing protein [Longimicrobium sp.]|uniref:PDZ domain-containing protein n=1 Tax=Longimicrobium sp. TaxID=2029185 RepID=UPI002C04E793|nr:PDZ domain-containing protein [Longimicrobium sp.]HSU14420.1 PDZ domain-containing protein [Longimicrobium sp.]
MHLRQISLLAALLALPVTARAQTGADGSGLRTVVVSGAPAEPADGIVVQTLFVQGQPDNFPTIVRVVQGSNAQRAGLMAGDTIVSVDGWDIRGPRPLFVDRTPGRVYTMRVRRVGEEVELTFVYPAPPAAPPPTAKPR